MPIRPSLTTSRAAFSYRGRTEEKAAGWSGQTTTGQRRLDRRLNRRLLRVVSWPVLQARCEGKGREISQTFWCKSSSNAVPFSSHRSLNQLLDRLAGVAFTLPTMGFCCLPLYNSQELVDAEARGHKEKGRLHQFETIALIFSNTLRPRLWFHPALGVIELKHVICRSQRARVNTNRRFAFSCPVLLCFRSIRPPIT